MIRLNPAIQHEKTRRRLESMNAKQTRLAIPSGESPDGTRLRSAAMAGDQASGLCYPFQNPRSSAFIRGLKMNCYG